MLNFSIYLHILSAEDKRVILFPPFRPKKSHIVRHGAYYSEDFRFKRWGLSVPIPLLNIQKKQTNITDNRIRIK